MSPSHRLLSALLTLLFTVVHASHAAAPSPPTDSQFLAAALCAAALERDVKSSLHSHPTAPVRSQWQHRLESAFAHLGDAYLNGLSAEAGKDLLQQAESSVADWPQDRLTQHVGSCERHGITLFEQASGLQKLLIRRSAQRLLDKELAKLTAPVQ